jgi:hypothetical protein
MVAEHKPTYIEEQSLYIAYVNIILNGKMEPTFPCCRDDP